MLASSNFLTYWCLSCLAPQKQRARTAECVVGITRKQRARTAECNGSAWTINNRSMIPQFYVVLEEETGDVNGIHGKSNTTIEFHLCHRSPYVSFHSCTCTSGNRGFGLALPSRFPYGPVPIVALVPVIGPRAPARTSPGS